MVLVGGHFADGPAKLGQGLEVQAVAGVVHAVGDAVVGVPCGAGGAPGDGGGVARAAHRPAGGPCRRVLRPSAEDPFAAAAQQLDQRQHPLVLPHSVSCSWTIVSRRWARRSRFGPACLGAGSADSRRTRETAAATAGRVAGSAKRASLQDRPDAPRPSARASQHSETAVRPGLRCRSRVAHAAPDGRRHAAEPPRPRVGAGGGADRPPERLLGACAALLGPGACVRCRSEARSEPRSSGFPGGRGCDPSGRIGCDRRPLSRSQAGAASAWRSTGAPRQRKGRQ